MTPLRLIPVLFLLLSALLVLSGCARKKPVLVVPQEQPPVVAPTPAPTPEVKTEPATTEPAAQSGEPAKEEANKAAANEKSGQTKPRRQHGLIRKPSPAVKAENMPPPDPKATPPEPRSTPAPLAPSISPDDAARDRASTDQLLQNTEATLNGIKRQLSKQEETMVAQIRTFMNQSRQAIKDNDPARAHTLAFKANQLSNELMRQR
jgi:hypothetical protein